MIGERVGLLLLATGVILVGWYAYLRVGDRVLGSLAHSRYRALVPWLFAGPAVLAVLVLLAFPALLTVWWSFFDADGTRFVGLANYTETLTDEVTRIALRNTVLWVLLLPSTAVLAGLVTAVLTDRVRYGALVKTALFLPIAISAVAAGVIWRFMYEYRPPGAAQTGTLNALVTRAGADPVAWIVDPATSNYALIGATLWTQAGFAMVIFSAALRAVPAELLEAARIDGASEWRAFRHITLPQLAPTIVVVATTMTVIALKAFDIVYVMTNGNYGTDVLSTVMYRALFTGRDNGLAGAVATILMLTVIPVMVFNVRQFRRHSREA